MEGKDSRSARESIDEHHRRYSRGASCIASVYLILKEMMVFKSQLFKLGDGYQVFGYSYREGTLRRTQCLGKKFATRHRNFDVISCVLLGLILELVVLLMCTDDWPC